MESFCGGSPRRRGPTPSMARMIPTAFGGVIVARNHLPGRKSNKSEWPHGGSLAKRAGGGIHCTLCSCQEIMAVADSGGLRPSRSASIQRIAQTARNWYRCNQASGTPSSTSCSRSLSLRRALRSSVTCLNDASRSWKSRWEVSQANWYGYPSFMDSPRPLVFRP